MFSRFIWFRAARLFVRRSHAYLRELPPGGGESRNMGYLRAPAIVGGLNRLHLRFLLTPVV